MATAGREGLSSVEDGAYDEFVLEHRGGGLRRANEVAFQIHARAWFLISLFLVGVWALAGFGYFWPAWPALGWGLAVALHGGVTYARVGSG